MEQLVVMYLPVIFSFGLVIFNIIKTISGLNLVNPKPHIKSLENKLNAKYDVILEKLNTQEEINKSLKLALDEQAKKNSELEGKMLEINASIDTKFDRQNEMLNKIVREDVELRADIRRIENDSEAVQE